MSRLKTYVSIFVAYIVVLDAELRPESDRDDVCETHMEGCDAERPVEVASPRSRSRRG